MRKLFLTILTVCALSASAQELNCVVTINTQQLRTTDPKVFITLQTALQEFMNTRSWTDDTFSPEERIECEFIITITNEDGGDKYRAQTSIVSRRPVYGSDYNTIMLNTVDKDFEFSYVEYQALEFNENVFLSNLTAMMAFYAYVVIGLDYESFSLRGGDKYFQKAFNIVSQASNREEGGWKAYDGTRNRYWLINNMLDPKYAGVRDVYYQYHRNALDLMYDNTITPVQTITKNLQMLDNINRTQPNSMIMQLFFTAKSSELQGIYSQANPVERSKAMNFLMRLDPINADKYQTMISGN